jgi:hypothetical protein
MNAQDTIIFEKAAKSVFDKMPSEAQSKAGLVEILLIISIIISILRLIQACRNNSSHVAALAADETNRVKVEKTVRRQMGIFKYRQYGPELVSAVIANGADSPVAELEQLFEALERIPIDNDDCDE